MCQTASTASLQVVQKYDVKYLCTSGAIVFEDRAGDGKGVAAPLHRRTLELRLNNLPADGEGARSFRIEHEA